MQVTTNSPDSSSVVLYVGQLPNAYLDPSPRLRADSGLSGFKVHSFYLAHCVIKEVSVNCFLFNFPGKKGRDITRKIVLMWEGLSPLHKMED